LTTAVGEPDRPLRATPSAQGLASSNFKHEHLSVILADALNDGSFEVHAESDMGASVPPYQVLEAIREDYPISIHGICMSIAGPEALDVTHLARFRDLVARYEPILVSELLAWSSHAGKFFKGLLALPCTKDTLDNVGEHITQVQEAIRRPDRKMHS